MPISRTAIVLAASTAFAAGAAAASSDFPTIVRHILESQTTGPLADMSASKRSAMIDCVVGALQPLPKGKKRYIVEGGDFDEQERRFGLMVYDNHAEWEQNIAGACAGIALRDDDTFAASKPGAH